VPAALVEEELRVVVAYPPDRYIGVQIDAPSLLEEALDLGEAVQPSCGAAAYLAGVRGRAVRREERGDQ